jgi:hypothetical protein
LPQWTRAKSGAACKISRLRWKENQERLGAEDAEMGLSK